MQRMSETRLKKSIRDMIEGHGGYRETARRVGIDHSAMWQFCNCPDVSISTRRLCAITELSGYELVLMPGTTKRASKRRKDAKRPPKPKGETP